MYLHAIDPFIQIPSHFHAEVHPFWIPLATPAIVVSPVPAVISFSAICRRIPIRHLNVPSNILSKNIAIIILPFYLIAHRTHLGHVTIATMDALVKSRRGSRRLLTRPLPEVFIEALELLLKLVEPSRIIT